MVALILLGAGASYGSGETVFGSEGPRKVPLGNQLFCQLEARGGEADRMPTKIKRVFERDGFETGLQWFYNHTGQAGIGENNGSMAKFLAETGKYLAMFKIGEGNIYIELLRSLKEFDVLYASLNYDILLEQAASRLGLQFRYGLSARSDTFRIIKPHGSSNFWHRSGWTFSNVEMRTMGHGRVEDIASMFTLPIEPLCDYSENLARYAAENSVPPAMALYAPGKRFLVASSFMAKQQQAWTIAALTASVIFLSGVGVFPDDQHIWEPLANSPAPLVYFGMADDENAFNRWISSARRRNARFERATFEQCSREFERCF